MNIISAINWSADPEIFRIGVVSIRWYGLLFSLAFIIGYQIMSWIFRSENKKQKDLEALTIWMIVGVVAGARLGHCFFYDSSYYLANPLEILMVWKGGLSSHGAGFGILIAMWLFTRTRNDISYIWALDRVAVIVPLAAFFVRLGNFMNSEIIGKSSELPWAVVFTHVDKIPRHPSQLYEAISYIIIFLILFFIYKKHKSNLPEKRLMSLFLVLLFSLRFFVEFFKENQSGFEKGLPIDMGQILSIPFIIAGIIFLIQSFRNKTT